MHHIALLGKKLELDGRQIRRIVLPEPLPLFFRVRDAQEVSLFPSQLPWRAWSKSRNLGWIFRSSPWASYSWPQRLTPLGSCPKTPFKTGLYHPGKLSEFLRSVVLSMAALPGECRTIGTPFHLFSPNSSQMAVTIFLSGLAPGEAIVNDQIYERPRLTFNFSSKSLEPRKNRR